MANPRLNLPLISTAVTDAQLGHVLRTIREWSRYVDDRLDALEAAVAQLRDDVDSLLP